MTEKILSRATVRKVVVFTEVKETGPGMELFIGK